MDDILVIVSLQQMNLNQHENIKVHFKFNLKVD